MQPIAADSGVPSAGFRLAAVPEQIDRYSQHMSGWTADLIERGATRPVESRVWSLGTVVLTWNDFPARRVARSAAQARADQLDHYQVHLPLGATNVRLSVDGGNETTLSPGHPVMVDLSRPYEICQGSGPTIQAYLPRELLDEILPAPGDLHGKQLNGSIATILADLLRSLTKSLPTMRIVEATDVAKSTMHLVAASLASTAQPLQKLGPAVESTLLRQACRFIEVHLAEPDLNTAHLCAALGLSRATVYRLFEPYGGVACHIRERRLVRIHEAIVGSKQHLPLARLAEDHGFKSATQFSRAFREHFGHSPSEAAAIGLALGPAPKAPKPSPGAYSLSDWLRPLRG